MPSKNTDPTFLRVIAGIYGYGNAKIVAEMIGADSNDILTGDGNSIQLPHKDGEAHKWAFYFSFNNSEQVKSPTPIYGVYDMVLKDGEDIIASEKITVATGSSMKFAVADKVGEETKETFGSGLKITEDSTSVSLNGTLNYIRDRSAYLFPVTMSVEKGFDEAVLTIDGKKVDLGSMLLEFSAEKMTYTVVIDLDGDGAAYSPTTYILTFEGIFQEISYGVLLADPFYGDDYLMFTSVVAGKSFVLPNGPDATKNFIGWKIEGEAGKVYSAGAFVILDAGMDANKDGNVVFTAVYDSEAGPEGVQVKIDSAEPVTKFPNEVITLPSLEGTGYVAWAVNGTVLGAQYIVNLDDAKDGVITIVGIKKVSGIQRTSYDMSVVLSGKELKTFVSSDEIGEQYFNMLGSFYYLVSYNDADGNFGKTIYEAKTMYAFPPCPREESSQSLSLLTTGCRASSRVSILL